jgi:dTDP-4-dehydrorhamnose reductase
MTGAKGMLAHALGNALAARGIAFFGIDRDTHDLSREADVRRMFTEHRPTLLLNCAAHTNVDKCEEEEQAANAINGHAPGMTAQYAGDHGTRLVHISTDFVFDGTADRPYRPDDAPNPLSAYGRSKLLGERKIQEANPGNWMIARTAWLYGQHGKCFPRTIVERARAGGALRVVDDQIGSPTHTVDLAEAILELTDRNAQGIFHLTNTGQTSWHGFTAAILEAFGVQAELSRQTTAEYRQIKPHSALRPAYSAMDGSAYEKIVGHPMRPWREALQHYAEAVKAAGTF